MSEKAIESMTSSERIRGAIGLQLPDRVPVGFLVDTFAATYCGVSVEDFVYKEGVYGWALEQCWEGLGRYDWVALGWGNKRLNLATFPLRFVWVEGNYQTQEEEIMTPDDYDLIIEKGYSAFLDSYYPRVRPELAISAEERHAIFDQLIEAMRIEGEEWRTRGVQPQPIFAFDPFDMFCQMRSYEKFVLDLYSYPEKILEACEISNQAIIEDTIDMSKRTGLDMVLIALHRSCYFSPRQFERFSLPSLKSLSEELVRAGLVPVLHCDGDWTAHLPYLLELPKAKCIVQLDGSTDIWKAKEILGGHMCIMGDVPASLTTLGTPAEVEEYCMKLMETVGNGGGFILSTGCDVPYTAKPENVKVIVDVAREHSFY